MAYLSFKDFCTKHQQSLQDILVTDAQDKTRQAKILKRAYKLVAFPPVQNEHENTGWTIMFLLKGKDGPYLKTKSKFLKLTHLPSGDEIYGRRRGMVKSYLEIEGATKSEYVMLQ